MVKLYTNGILATKVLFSNEMYLICQQLGVNYEEVRVLSVLDPRVGASHTVVPGPDGQLGFGGHCFPKDINNLRYVAWEAKVLERLFTAVIERNDEIREKKDWLDMQGRAVTGE
jgi:UDPglucose 6-dehydrogenase